MTTVKKPIKKRVLQCVSLPSANRFLPQPFEVGEKLIYLGEIKRTDKHPDTFYKQFFRVMRLKSKRMESVSRKHFKFLT